VERLFGGAAAALVIWTTTPWTLAANLAVVANPQIAYAGIPVERGGRREYLIVARDLAETFLTACHLPIPPKADWIEIAGDTLPPCAACAISIPSLASRAASAISA